MSGANELVAPLRRLLRRMGLHHRAVVTDSLRETKVRGLAERTVRLYFPANFERGRPVPLLLMLDGQTAPQWKLAGAIGTIEAEGALEAPVVAAVPASDERLDEYGTSGALDFAGRGKRADRFQDYLVNSVLPMVRERCGVEADPARTGIFGGSMGGLCAFDVAWRHPDVFGFAGVFSGSLWWRTDNSSPAAQQASRIVHRRVREARRGSRLRCWFQAGTRDELSDRDGNGVIDAIQDTRELMTVLSERGYRDGVDMTYREVEGGEHNEATWAGVLPEFFRWALPEKD